MTRALLLLLAGGFLFSTGFAQQGLTEIPDPAVEVQQAGFKIPDGLEVNVFAADPMISKPVQMNWDAHGRLWLVSSPMYPHIEPLQEESDQVLVLEDLDSDGRADKVTSFASGLHIPTAVIPGDGGAYVANSTEILFLKDTDGDLVADEREVMLSGFGTEDTHHLIHTFRHGPDGMLYFAQSIYIHSHIETPYGVRRLMGGGVWHFRPETKRLEILSKGLVNPWGYGFDQWGQSFATDGAGREGINYIFPRSVFVTSPGAKRTVSGLNPGQPKHCGLEFLSGRHVPEELRGQVLAPDFRGHRINRFKLEPKDSSYKSIQQEDLLASVHRAFRPIDVKMGPDGAVYIADWYNPIIQHGEVDFRDPRRDHVHGRIWRVTFKDRPLVEKPDIPGASIEELLEMLSAPEDWTRHFAKRELRHRGAEKVLPKLDAWSATLESDALKQEALWTYQSLDRLNPTLLDALLKSDDPRYRAAALRVVYHRHQEVEKADEILQTAIRDENAQVRLWAISCLAQVGGVHSVDLALQALDHPMDEMLDFALWSLVREKESEWLPSFTQGELQFDGRIHHLLFAARALGKPIGIEAIFSALESGNLSESQADDATRYLSRVGSAQDLARLFAIASKPGGRLVVTLDTLIEAKRLRKLQPSGNLSSIAGLVKSENPEVVQRAALLAGMWNVTEARAELEEVFVYESSSEALRLAAAEGLRYLGGKETLALFESVARTSESSSARMIAVNELARMNPKLAAQCAISVLAKAENTQQSASIFDTFIRNPIATDALSLALVNQTLPEDVAVSGLQRAQTSGKNLRPLLNSIRKAGGLKKMKTQLTPEEMSAMVQRVQQAGNPHRGEQIYRRMELQCTVCHAIGGVGGVIGPDLVSIGSSAPIDYLVNSLLLPNDKIKEGYHMTLVVTKSGDSVAGGLISEDDREVVLRDNLGNLKKVAKNEVASKTISPVSMMPAGLTANLREDEFVDLVRFLSELGKEGDFKVSPQPIIRHWSALLPHRRTRDDIGHYGEEIFAENYEGYQWMPVGSMVDGSLPLNELPKVVGRGKNRWGVVRFDVAGEVGKEVVLKINETNLMHLFVGEERISIPEKGPASVAVKIPGDGKQFTIAANSAYRSTPVRVVVADKKPDPVKKAKRSPAPATPDSLKFRVQQLHKDNIEGIAVGDIDQDGDLDIVAGEHWYTNPDWKQRKIRKVLPFGADYMQDNGDHLWDVNGDGWLDLVSGQFTETKVHWFENPKGEALLSAEEPWPAHLLVDTQTTRNEATLMHDIDGDGTPEWFENSWGDDNPMLIWKLTKTEDGTPTMKKITVGESGNGHGQGIGDVNGDGLEDIVFKQGWYEQPAENPWGQPWKWRKDMALPHASVPILILDVNGDGRNDLIWGDGHNYGLYWEEQLLPKEDGTTVWEQHLIDKAFSQAHTMAWEDIDNDGQSELITGKRYYAHSGKDAGSEDEIVINYYKWNPDTSSFVKFEAHRGQAGVGLQIRVADLDADGWKEIIVPGKSGTHILWNEGLAK
tara:strand:- start:7053 stop:11594 length:4542 start_codon:yes stop_codon:yes gene_type:complete